MNRNIAILFVILFLTGCDTLLEGLVLDVNNNRKRFKNNSQSMLYIHCHYQRKDLESDKELCLVPACYPTRKDYCKQQAEKACVPSTWIDPRVRETCSYWVGKYNLFN